jgi:MFS family permease
VGLDTAVNIALPAISAAFGVPATSIQWIVLTYVVSFAVALIPAGRLADRAGHPRVFRAGVVLSGVAHVLCGLAPSWRGLLGARVVQGLGAALIMASAPALVTLSAEASRRGRALGHLGLAASVGAVVGPLGGGFLVHSLGWRSVYLGRLPLVLLALAMGRRLSAGREPEAPALSGTSASPRAGKARWGRVADPRTFAAANGAHLLANTGLFAIWLLVPYYLIDRRGFAAGTGGLLFAAAPLAQACAMPLGGRTVDRGLGRVLAVLGLVVESAGLWLTGRLGASASAGNILMALGLAGFGSGLFIVANMHYVMNALPRPQQGVAGSVISLMRTAGIVLGSTITTAVYATRQSAHGALGTEAATAAAFADAFDVAAAVALVAVLLSLLPPRTRRTPEGPADASAPDASAP